MQAPCKEWTSNRTVIIPVQATKNPFHISDVTHECSQLHYPPFTANIYTTLLKVRSRKRLDDTRPLTKPRPKNPIRILEHAIFKTDDDELTTLEARFDKPANVLRVREIECGIDFVEDVHGRGLELEEGHDER